MNVIKEYMSKLFKIINRDEMKILPGHLAFFLVLSLIPSITLVGLICNIFSISISDLLNLVSEIIPKGALEVIEPFLDNKIGSMTIIYFIIGFILASNSAYSITITSNTLYGIKNKSYIKGRIKALFLTILLMFLFTFIVLVLAYGNSIVSFILNLKVFNGISDTIFKIFIYLKWPIAFFIIYVVLNIIYKTTPDRKIRRDTLKKGALFTTIGWIMLTAIYSYYANNIATYDMFYGNLSNIIILIMWVYLMAYIFVIGIAINVNNYNYMMSKVENEENEKQKELNN